MSTKEIELWRTEIVYDVNSDVLCPLCGKNFISQCGHSVEDVLRAYYLAVNTLAEISVIQGSAGNMIRKAHTTLLEIEKL